MIEKREDMSTTVINLFWTGGWDSTFRLLYLLLVEGKKVRPYYILDTERESTIFELKAREAIKDNLFKKYPETKKLLLPTIIVLKTDIKPNETVTSKYQRLASAAHIGIQYEWLSRFAHEFRLYDAELCIAKDPPGQVDELDSLLIPELQGEGHDCRMRDNTNNDDLNIFKHFRFSTIHLTKLDMKQLSKQLGFYNVLRNTWFCHSPTKEGLPCGGCVPCQVRKESGLPYEFAKRSLGKRIYWKANSLMQKAKRFLESFAWPPLG
jgi:hypothetical protein